VLKIKIPPHSKLPWHQHPAINAAYVVSGTLFVESHEGGLSKKLVAGDVLPEMVNRSHRGYTEDEDVELVVFYAGSEGKPVTVLDK
jgi:quercetin dioxygenase-like cupin family protein